MAAVRNFRSTSSPAVRSAQSALIQSAAGDGRTAQKRAFRYRFANRSSRPNCCRCRQVRGHVESRVAIQSEPFLDPARVLRSERASGRLARQVL